MNKTDKFKNIMGILFLSTVALFILVLLDYSMDAEIFEELFDRNIYDPFDDGQGSSNTAIFLGFIALAGAYLLKPVKD